MSESPVSEAPKKDRTPIVIAAVVFALFIWGTVAMFQARYESGELYAPLSSYRTDPKGMRILYESSKRMDQLNVTRNLKQLNLWEPEVPTTIVLAGYNSWSLQYLSEDERERLEELARKGHRLVITLRPYDWFGVSAWDDTNATNALASTNDFYGLSNWSVVIDNEALPKGINYSEATFATNWFPEAEDRTITTLSPAVFAITNNVWEVIATRKNKPVIIERSMGEGSIIMASDSYFMCNQGLFEERHAELLSWMIEQHPNLSYDETHLGTGMNPGIASLMRRYNLEWFMLSMVLLALLYIWRSGRSLAPIPVSDEGEEDLEGRDHLSGVVNLLSRSMSPKEVLVECGNRWHQPAKHT